MQTKPFLTWSRAAFGLLVAGVVIVTAVTIVNAHGPGPATGVIHSCVKDNGELTIVSANATCKNNETALDWNGEGVQGPPGQAGVSGYELVLNESESTVVIPNAIYLAGAQCPDGKKVLGGGGAIGFGLFAETVVIQSYPSSETDWQVVYHSLPTAQTDPPLMRTFRAYAICADVGE